MSHTIRKINLGNTAIAEILIVDYVAGGEAFTLVELGLTGSVVAVFLIGLVRVDAIVRDLGILLAGGKVLVMDRFKWAEMPSTVGLNFTFVALVRGS